MQQRCLDLLSSSGKSVLEAFCGKDRCEMNLLHSKLQEQKVDHSAFRSLQAQADKSPKAIYIQYLVVFNTHLNPFHNICDQ